MTENNRVPQKSVSLGVMAFLLAFAPLAAPAATLNVSLNTSAVAGTPIKVVFDVTANTQYLNTVDIDNFSAPGGKMGLPETTGGLIDGDLILGINPAPFTYIETATFFNELIVNLAPVGNAVTFSLSYTTNSPTSAVLPDEIDFYLLDGSYNPLFPTADPLGADALFAIDLTGASTSPQIFSPAVQTSPGNIQVTVPGSASSTAPEPGPLSLALIGTSVIGLKIRKARRV